MAVVVVLRKDLITTTAAAEAQAATATTATTNTITRIEIHSGAEAEATTAAEAAATAAATTNQFSMIPNTESSNSSIEDPMRMNQEDMRIRILGSTRSIPAAAAVPLAMLQVIAVIFRVRKLAGIMAIMTIRIGVAAVRTIRPRGVVRAGRIRMTVSSR